MRSQTSASSGALATSRSPMPWTAVAAAGMGTSGQIEGLVEDGAVEGEHGEVDHFVGGVDAGGLRIHHNRAGVGGDGACPGDGVAVGVRCRFGEGEGEGAGVDHVCSRSRRPASRTRSRLAASSAA